MKKFIILFLVLALCVNGFPSAFASDASHYEFGPIRFELPGGATKESDKTYSLPNGTILSIQTISSTSLQSMESSMGPDGLLRSMMENTPGTSEIEVTADGNGLATGRAKVLISGINADVQYIYYRNHVVMIIALGFGVDSVLADIRSSVQITGYEGTSSAAEIEYDVTATPNGVYLNDGPMHVSVSEDDWNVLFCGIPEDARTISRMGKSRDTINEYMAANSYQLVLYPLDWQSNDFQMMVKIKDKKYASASRIEQNQILLGTATGMASDGYTTETINGVDYYVFNTSMIAGNYQRRYMTIVDGDMIYFIAQNNQPLTPQEEEQLRLLVEKTTYIKE